MKKRDINLIIEDSANETKAILIFQSIVELILGFFLIFFPGISSKILCIIIGSLMAGYGIFDIISFITNSRPYSFRQGLFSGVLTTALGLAFIVQAEQLVNLLSIVLGILIIIESIVNLRRALLIKEMGFGYWYITLILSFLTFAAGLIIIVYPNLFVGFIFTLIGIIIVAQCVIDIWSIHRITKLKKAFEQKYKDEKNTIYIDADKK